MEEKKLDINSIIGFVLIFGILIYWFYTNQPTPEEVEAQKQATEQVQDSIRRAEAAAAPQQAATPAATVPEGNDSLARAAYASRIGAFSYTPAVEGTTLLENDVLSLEISNKGGEIVEARMKQFVNHDSLPVYLVREGNAQFSLEITTSDNRVLNTRDLFFEPTLSREGENSVLSMKAMAGPRQFLEYRYTIRPGEYLLDFDIPYFKLSSRPDA